MRADGKQLKGVTNITAYLATPLAVTYAASIALDVAASNDFAIGLLTGNVTFTFSNPNAGRQGLILVKQDTTGGRTVTFTAPSTYTIVRDANVADLSAASAASTITLFAYAMFALGGTNYLQLSKAFLI